MPQGRDSAILDPEHLTQESIIARTTQCDVLIVEDSVVQCMEMADYLRHAKLSVETAHDAVTAVARATAFEPRVVVLDYNLPDMNLSLIHI